MRTLGFARYMKKILPINVTPEGNAYGIKASYFKNAAITTLTGGGGHFPCTGVIEIYDNTEDTTGDEEGVY